MLHVCGWEERESQMDRERLFINRLFPGLQALLGLQHIWGKGPKATASIHFIPTNPALSLNGTALCSKGRLPGQSRWHQSKEHGQSRVEAAKRGCNCNAAKISFHILKAVKPFILQ